MGSNVFSAIPPRRGICKLLRVAFLFFPILNHGVWQDDVRVIGVFKEG